VHDVRLKLATQGLPKGSVTGFELMENSKFGITQFQERLNFQRGLEGELTRSILALNAVQSARVHLALPNQNGFFREQQKPSASVLLSLHPGRMLDRAQIAGIVHLVASSVPEMEPSAVSVVDDTGKLLSQSPDGNAGGVDMQQFLYTQQVEQQYAPHSGHSGARGRQEQCEGPGLGRAGLQPDRIDLRAASSQSVHRRRGRAQPAGDGNQWRKTATPPTGVPGATSNQPPQNSTAPINGANPAPQAAGAGQGNAQGNKRESITNYEVDKTVKVTRGSTGTVKRLTAAVVVNAPLAAAAAPMPRQRHGSRRRSGLRP
jgi:flagellar M-ring protein FliF